MKIIAVGCEYSGVTTLLNGIDGWGRDRGWHFHGDDHFSIPDRVHLAPAEQREMAGLSPVLKERFQRMQLVYHYEVLAHWDHCLFGGYHIEEEIYGPRYYYPNLAGMSARFYERPLPPDVILVHLFARPEVIAARMEADPHDFEVIDKADIPELLEQFSQSYRQSFLFNRFEIDTSDLNGEELLARFLTLVRPRLDVRDLLLLTNEKLDG